MNITVVMPYWERSVATRRTLESFDRFYGDDVKVIIVDDGSPTDPAKPLEADFERLTVIELPVKTEPKNPCVPMNIGVAAVDTPLLGLTNPETYHDSPVLYEMRDLIASEKDYILAPAWCPESREWHCHPDFPPPDIPPGTGFHHMALLNKGLWDIIGGMDEDYRDGYCFDDTDLVMRLVSAGANFMFSTQPVTHARTGAKAPPPALGWSYNHDLFMSKWGPNGTSKLHRSDGSGRQLA